MLLAILVAMPYQADALEDKVVIVTSYPKDLTGPAMDPKGWTT
jgi:hypothetical protein